MDKYELNDVFGVFTELLQKYAQKNFVVPSYNMDNNTMRNFDDFMDDVLKTETKDDRYNSSLFWTLQHVVFHMSVILVANKYVDVNMDLVEFGDRLRRYRIMTKLGLKIDNEHEDEQAKTWRVIRNSFQSVQGAIRFRFPNWMVCGTSYWKYNQGRTLTLLPGSDTYKIILKWHDLYDKNQDFGDQNIKFIFEALRYTEPRGIIHSQVISDEVIEVRG